jgi:hypothetical protein
VGLLTSQVGDAGAYVSAVARRSPPAYKAVVKSVDVASRAITANDARPLVVRGRPIAIALHEFESDRPGPKLYLSDLPEDATEEDVAAAMSVSELSVDDLTPFEGKPHTCVHYPSTAEAVAAMYRTKAAPPRINGHALTVRFGLIHTRLYDDDGCEVPARPVFGLHPSEWPIYILAKGIPPAVSRADLADALDVRPQDVSGARRGQHQELYAFLRMPNIAAARAFMARNRASPAVFDGKTLELHYVRRPIVSDKLHILQFGADNAALLAMLMPLRGFIKAEIYHSAHCSDFHQSAASR